METCINISHPEYRHLKEVSGLPEFSLNAYCRKYLDERGRFPKLGELPFADSTSYLTKNLQIKEDGSTTIKNVLDFTKTNSIEEAIIKLNTEYSDQIIDIKELGEDVIIDIQHRAPVVFKDILDNPEIDWNHSLLDNLVNSTVFFNHCVAGLSRKLGIGIKTTTNYDIQHTPELNQAISNAWNVKGFVHNETIYVNTDNTSADTPIHELMHIFIGGIKTLNPNLYLQLLDNMLLDEEFESYLNSYLDRTRNDAAEEILVEMFANYITGLDSDKNFFNNPEIYDCIDLMIDIILNPLISSRSLSQKTKISMSMKQLGLKLHSAAIEGFYEDKYKENLLQYATSHQKINNMKRDLVRNGKLLEFCE